MIRKLELDINSEAFENLRDDFNYVLNDLIDKMVGNQDLEGSLSVKVKIKLDPTVDQNTGEAYTAPQISFKTASNISRKKSVASDLTGDFQLAFDKEGGRYQIAERPSSQYSFDDMEGGE